MLTTSSTSIKLFKPIQSSLLWVVMASFSLLNLGMIAQAATHVGLDSSLQNTQTVTEISLAQKPQFFPLKDGTYLYGQSPQREQLGQEYLVFKVNEGKVTGAFYQPRSEYSCFSGELTPSQLSLSIRDPYDNSVSPYAIALKPQAPVAGNAQNLGNMTLDDYYALGKLSANDQRILKDCINH
ncbi:MAG: hypothetical protein DCF12_14200 [Snowella sp.]|nr:MAG: hypothetical protein DCF12_14200 [Snowella sp.]